MTSNLKRISFIINIIKFKTSITNITPDGTEIIRGKNLEDLMRGQSFSETIFFLLFQKMPSEKEKKMWDALLVAAIDHGPGTASALTARISASAKNSMHTSLAAGLLGLGERHGLAIEGAMRFFKDNKDTSDLSGLLKQMKDQKKYIPGFGHKVLTVDSRALTLLEIAKEQGYFLEHGEFALKVREELNSSSSKPLPINIDGAMAAILCDMNVDVRLAHGIFMIARVPGLVAHIYEETVSDEGIRRLEEGEIEYVGL
jgi:citryl-CoA lyase